MLLESNDLNKIIELFNSVGLSKDKSILLIENFNKRHRYFIDTFYKKSVELINFLLSLGIKKEKIGSILCRFYPIFTYNLDSFQNNLNHLKEIGFTKQDIIKMITLSPTILAFNNKVDESFNYLISLGYSKEDVIGMIKKAPNILTHSSDYIEKRIEFYLATGMSKDDALKVFKRVPNLIAYSNDILRTKINNLIDLGFTKEIVYSILRVNPSILAYTEESILDRLNIFINLGFTKEEAIRLYSSQKTLFTMNPESIKDKIKVIKECGYKDDEIKGIIKKYPGVLSLSNESIKDKITFYSTLGLRNIIVRESKHLMQSLRLSKARSEFLEAKGLKVDETNYRRLFMGERYFINQFHKTNEEVIKEYSLKLKR